MPTLHWIGKEKVTNHHLDIPYHTLDLQYNFGLNQDVGDLKDAKDLNSDNPSNATNQDSDNLIIHADNLLALKSLLPQYEGRVKCIYIDPPYNTGNEGWVYNDNVSSPRFKKWLGQVVGKEGEDLTRHDKWLCMMYPRLKLLHKLLAEDGAIFISIDDNEQASLKMMMDEIFGAGNFITVIHWKRSESQNNSAKFLSVVGEFIVCYVKNINGSVFNKTELQETAIKEYRYEDEKGKFRRGTIIDNSRGKHLLEVTAPNGIKRKIKSIRTEDFFLQKEKEGLIYWTETGTPYLKLYLENSEGQICSNWFDKVGVNEDASETLTKLNIDFQFSKPYSLIEKILQIATDKDSIILDSFAGSGTTAHAVLNLNKQDGGNRKFILIEMEDYAETITAERVKRVINGYGSTEGTGGSFSFYTLGERVLDDEQNLNPNLALHKIHGYIWYSETHTAYTQQATAAGYLGKYNNTGIYFHYQPHQVTVLDDAYLMNVTELCEQYIMYADICLLPETLMHKHNIIFKKIPRDISKL